MEKIVYTDSEGTERSISEEGFLNVLKLFEKPEPIKKERLVEIIYDLYMKIVWDGGIETSEEFLECITEEELGQILV